MSLCLSVSLSLCLSVSLSLCLPVSLSLWLSVSQSLCLSVSLSLCLFSVSLFLCFSISLSLCFCSSLSFTLSLTQVFFCRRNFYWYPSFPNPWISLTWVQPKSKKIIFDKKNCKTTCVRFSKEVLRKKEREWRCQIEGKNVRGWFNRSNCDSLKTGISS